MDALRDDVISKVRSCLISCKGQCSLRQLADDYRIILGETIPLSRLGFKSLPDFIGSVPSLVLSKSSNGEYMVDAKMSEKSAHISKMVQRQKPGKKKAHTFNRMGKSSMNYNSRRQPGGATSGAVNHQRWRPKNVSSPRKYKSSTRPADVYHSQFVNTPKVRSKIVVPERSTMTNNNNNDNSSSYRVNLSERLKSSLNDNIAGSSSNDNNISVSTTITVATPTNTTSSINNISENNPLSSTKKRLSLLMKEITLDGPTMTMSMQNNNLNNTTRRLSSQSPPMIIPEITPSPLYNNSSNLHSPNSSFLTINSNAPQNSIIMMGGSSASSNNKKEFIPTGDSVKDLENLVDIHQLGPVNYAWKNYIARTKKSAAKSYTCKVTIGEKHYYSSYPNEFADETKARQFTAQKALDDLLPKYNPKKHPLPVSTNFDVLQRVPQMLQKHSAGIWAWQLVANYIDKYKEQLPLNWCEVVDTCPYVSIQDSGGVILVYYKDVFQTVPKNVQERSRVVSDVSVAAKTIEFGPDERLYARITSIITAGELWCQQIDTKEHLAFVNMMESMEHFYTRYSHEFQQRCININSYYVVRKDDVYCRAKALEINGDDSGGVKCLLIDYGSDYVIPNEDIYQMRREFTIEDAQAFVVRLVGLEELYDVSADSEHLQNLLLRRVVLELTSEYSKDDDIILPVVMYDTDTGASLNAKLIKDLTMESATPVLNKKILYNVYVTNVDVNGDIYIQIHGPHFLNLKQLIANLMDEIDPEYLNELKTSPSTMISKETSIPDQIYLIKSLTQPLWKRIKILDWSPLTAHSAQIYYIDYGTTDVINVRAHEIYPLDKLDDVVNQYPEQTVKVRLLLDRIASAPDVISKLLLSFDDDVTLIMIVVKFDDDNDNDSLAYVEFYKRSELGALICLNKSIADEIELKMKYNGSIISTTDGSFNNNTNISNNNNYNDNNSGKSNNHRSRLLKQLNHEVASKESVPSGGYLDEPVLPRSDEFFNVNVPFAVSPWNFFVQPLDSMMKLTDLMVNLQIRYEGRKFDVLKLEDIERGRIYASRFNDGRWYRTSVLKVIHQGSISVCYCDFGYYTNLSIQQLVPLDVEFTKLPYQALKAKLAGVKPTEGAWSMEGCELFKDLVIKKQFVSIVTQIEKDELYRSDNVLKMILIDTSTNVDKHISDELIARGIAIKEENSM